MSNSRLNFSRIDLREINLSSINFENAILTGAILSGLNLTEKNLTRAKLRDANLEGANLTRAILIKVESTNGNFTDADLTEAILTEAILLNANLTRAILTSANLTKAYLYSATLTGADLTGANLTEANLTGANLTGADLTGADLTGANLTGAILTGVILTGAILTGANLSVVDLTGVNLTGVNLNGVTLSQMQRQQIMSRVIPIEQRFQDIMQSEMIRDRNPRSIYTFERPVRAYNQPRSISSSRVLVSNDLHRYGPCMSVNGEQIYSSEPCEILRGRRINNSHQEEARPYETYSIYPNLDSSDNSGQQQRRMAQSINDSQRTANFREALRRLSLPIQSREVWANNPSVVYSSAQRRIPIRSGFEFIEVSEDKLKLQKSSNGSCPLYNDLYDFVLSKDLSSNFRFRYSGKSVIDAGGVTRDIFEKLLPVYTHKFFVSIETNNECVILRKDVDMKKFTKDTEKMIFLARAANTKIFLKIDPRLLSLLSSDKYLEYFSNNKKESFADLYHFISLIINTNVNNYNVLVNNSAFLRNKNNNNIIRQYKTTTNAELKNTLKREIRVRRILIEFGFKDWNQFFNMNDFFKNFIRRHNEIFLFKLNFNLESFLSKFKIFIRNSIEIPLSKFGKLSDDKTTFEFKEQNKDVREIYDEYEYLRPFLDYIIGPSSTDKRREMCMAYATGSSYYPGLFKIMLRSTSDPSHFVAHTCSTSIDFFKYHKNRVFVENKEAFIEDQIKSKSGNDFSLA